MGTRIWQLLCAVTVVVFFAAAPVRAQSCSDGNECTNPDVCNDGTCTGTPVAGSCDDGNPCTINDTCVSGTCQGTPNIGASCGMTGCEGTCGPNGLCLPNLEKQGQPCDDGFACTNDDMCLGTVCFGALKTCPDADSNPCTLDACNFATGQCQTFGISPCGECETCNAEGGCVAANDDADCDDFNQCTGPGKCAAGHCLAGAAVGTPTETPLTPAATNTATVTPTDTGTPLGTLTSTVTPTITDTVTPGGPTATDSPTVVPTSTNTEVPLTPTDTPVPTITDTPTVGPTDTETLTPSETPTGQATISATPTGLPTGTATATATFTATGIPTGTATATATATGIPTGTATATATGIPTGTATATATATNTGGNTPTITATRTNTPTVVIPATSTATATRTPLPVMASIIVGDAAGAPNSTVPFDVSLETQAQIAGVQVDIAFDPKAAIVAKEDGKPDCTVNPAIDKDATSFAFQPSDCTVGTTCTGIRAIVLSLENLDPIPDGSKLFTCNLALAADAAGTYPLTCSNPGAGDTNGDKVGADCTSGTVTVEEAVDATIVVSDVVGAAGQDGTLTVSLETGEGVEVAGTQNDTVFPDGVGVVARENGRPNCTVNPEIDKGGTSFAFIPNGCTPGTDCDGVRALVLALDNVNPIPDGSVLYTCLVSIGSTVEDGTYPITCLNDGASDPDGHAVSTACATGDVIVGVQPTRTSTPSGTPTVTPTVTPTATPTPEPGVPTFTSTATNTPSASPTRTHKKNDEDDGCQVVAPAESSGAWLLLPLAALLWRRRR